MALFSQGEEKNYIIEQLYVLINAGMDVHSALESLTEEVHNKSLKETLIKVRDRVNSGSQLSDAFEGTRIIPTEFLSFIRSGEASGNLKEQLRMVAEQFARDKELRSKVISASIYPIFIFVVVIILGGVNLFLVLPQVTSSFTKLGGELPWFTQLLLDFGIFTSQYGAIVFPSALVLILLTIFLVFFNTKTKFIGQEILLRTPGIKDILRQVELSRFGFVFGLLTKSGITFTDALNFLAGYAGVQRYRNFYKYLMEGINDGLNFRELFAAYKNLHMLFPRSVQNLITSAEKSGHLSETLMQIGDIYKKKLDISTQTLSAVIEPVLIFIVWGFVLLLALAIIFPLYSIIGNIGIF